MIRHLLKISFLFLLFLPLITEAISLRKDTYYVGEILRSSVECGPWVIYNTDSGSPMGGQSACGVDDNMMVDGLIAGNYSLIEINEDGACENEELNYSGCKSSPYFIGEYIFKIVPAPAGGGYSGEYDLPVVSESPSGGGGGGPTSHRPEVSIYSPLDGKVYGTNIEVIYEATDKNDSLGQSNLGLDMTPVTIFFSKTSDIRQRTQLGTNLPAKGVFKWNTKELPEGDTYNIIVSAKDKVNEIGESVSGNFSIDHTAPVFIIKTEPNITRGEDVKIIAESSKELSAPPVLRVAQNEFNFMDVLMSGDGFRFEGIYKVIGGYDGPAKIDILGKDLAGNESSLIVSGGQFSVGVLPPPKPIITYPLDRDVSPTGVIEVKGKARKDTEVILSLNGSEKFSKNPDSSGEFVFSNIKLRPEFNFGTNIISIIAKDAIGSVSEPADLNIKYNLSPDISVESPVKGQTLGTTTVISVRAVDKNKDRLNFKYEASKDGGKNWITLFSGVDKRAYTWDTTIYEDGDYLIRVTVSDGTTEKTATVDGLIIKNLLPTFSFSDGDRTFTNKKSLVISGNVSSSIKSPIRSNILSVEYSLDGGASWIEANIDSGLNTPDTKFSISIENTTEGVHKIMLRAKDDRGMYGRGVKSVIAIFEPPVIPTITSHKDGSVVNDLSDINKLEAGIQFVLEGTSKPGTIVNVSSANKIFTGKADSSGKFSISGVTVRQHGENKLEVYAEDEAGNVSGKNSLILIYNNPPALSFINPRPDRGLNHRTFIEFSSVDPDGDEVKRTILSLKKPGDDVFKVLDINSPSGKFELDVSSFEERGGYELRLESTDGTSSSVKTVSFYVDNGKPAIFVDAIANRVFKKDFRFEATGSAVDSLSGVEFVEYSLDSEHWFKALISKGYLTKKASFRIRHPFTLDDGEYEIKFRSVDLAGNVSDVWLEKITVDTMPPRMGSFDLSYKGISLYPEDAGFKIIAGSEVKIKASFEFDTSEATLYFGEAEVPLAKIGGNIWEGEFSFIETGTYEIKFSAKDNSNNAVLKKTVGIINAEETGKILIKNKDDAITSDTIPGATLTVMIFNQDRQRFERWPGEYYGIDNPLKSGQDGRYSLFLPAGQYKISVQKPGFVKLESNEFYLSDGRFVNFDLSLKRREGLRGFVEDVLEKIMIF